MGFFSKNEAEKRKEKEIENAHKYTEILKFPVKEDLEIEIAKRIEAGRIIQKIDYEMSGSPTSFSALIMYDIWAEKARADKEKGLGLGR